MIIGKIVDGRVVLPVNFCITEGTDLAIDCVVDTGFNDYITLQKINQWSDIKARICRGGFMQAIIDRF